ncbi:glucan biosynthesis protein G [Phenylobacterium deserti]|uniref:glucan biosynthesis protein G n=1 Tax=Phenylobacterium deserti TaxID=1914756 RepID=UPI00140348DE|nr:glucan biosynthesis protein G [Phenylobacterium deserti]
MIDRPWLYGEYETAPGVQTGVQQSMRAQTLRRRDVLAAAPAALALPHVARAQTARVADFVRRRAAALAAAPYQPRSTELPRSLAELNYDGYRDLRFRPDQAVWRAEKLPFQLQMFHRGGLHREAVELFEVHRGQIRPIGYRPDMFTAGPVAGDVLTSDLGPQLGFAGFRIHTPINDASRFDEFAVFLGASYFRLIPKDCVYGLSARGLELGSGDPGEEFPAFRSFWIERPAPDARTITVHALLDSPSVAGAYRFVIAPGEATVMDVQASLFPRKALSNAGLAPLTSMFLFGPEQPRRYDDFRPEVHDSDGLIASNPAGERLWRPLVNPQRVEISQFHGDGLGGFGLLQRRRDLASYQDLEAAYHRRPGAWIEPTSNWGAGAVRLVELPARSEAEDNIVASWRPARPLQPGLEHTFGYRLRWAADPVTPASLAPVTLWRTGQGGAQGVRLFIVEYGGVDLSSQRGLAADVAAGAGAIRNLTLHQNEATGAARVSFEYDPQGASDAELRARLVRGGQPMSESWVKRWQA